MAAGDITDPEAKNIMPWRYKPGQTGNPSGRPRTTPEEKKLRKNFIHAMSLLQSLSMKEIRAIAEDESQPASKVIVAKSVLWAVDKGSAPLFSEIFNRTIGRVREKDELDDPFDGLSQKDMIDLAKKEIEKLEKEDG